MQLSDVGGVVLRVGLLVALMSRLSPFLLPKPAVSPLPFHGHTSPLLALGVMVPLIPASVAISGDVLEMVGLGLVEIATPVSVAPSAEIVHAHGVALPVPSVGARQTPSVLPSLVVRPTPSRDVEMESPLGPTHLVPDVGLAPRRALGAGAKGARRRPPPAFRAVAGPGAGALGPRRAPRPTFWTGAGVRPRVRPGARTLGPRGPPRPTVRLGLAVVADRPSGLRPASVPRQTSPYNLPRVRVPVQDVQGRDLGLGVSGARLRGDWETRYVV